MDYPLDEALHLKQEKSVMSISPWISWYHYNSITGSYFTLRVLKWIFSILAKALAYK